MEREGASIFFGKLNKIACAPAWKRRCGALLLAAAAALAAAPPEHAAGAEAETAASSVQKLLDAAPPGSTVKLPPGTYAESVIVAKPLRIEAEGAKLTGSGKDVPVVDVKANGAELIGLSVEKAVQGEEAAVRVTADNVLLEGLQVVSRSYGIKLQQSDGSIIRDSSVEPPAAMLGRTARASERRNGIDLYRSHHNRIENNRVSSMFDGIYLEGSNGNKVTSNQIDHSRYGIHIMYTKNSVLADNTGSFNVTGIMAMMASGAEVTGNAFALQKGNVNSQGMLFYQVDSSKVENNKLVGNRVGLYIERSKNNVWSRNDVSYNFVGIQLLDSEDNRLENNRFISNVIETQADGSRNNELLRNYWDAFEGLDPNGDGMSDLPYLMNPLFQRLTKDNSAYQLFFQSPGMKFLESLLASGQQQWARDSAPLMEPPADLESVRPEEKTAAGTAAAGAALLAASLIIMYTGVRRR